MNMWKKFVANSGLVANLKERYRSAEQESDYKIHYRIVGNGVLVADAKDIVKSGAFKEQLAQSAELEKLLKNKQQPA